MTAFPPGTVAVIFAAQRTANDASDTDGYDAAAIAMAALAACQTGYVGFRHARGADGYGIAVSYWTDEAAAIAWRDQPDHAAIRDAGRARWYDAYTIEVAAVTRGYDWSRA